MPGPALPGQLLPLAAAACLSAAATAAWIALARHRNLVDTPDERRLHDTPTPRGGGIGMALVLVAAWAFAAGQGLAPPGLAWGLALAAGTGLLDDLLPVPSLAKLAGQGAAALVIAWALPWPGLAAPWAAAASALFALVLVNFWNFMDGANGMVAAQTAVVAAAFALLAGDPALALPAWVAVAACLGFLPFNLPRARVFMGDTGSHVLGATVAVLALSGLRRGEVAPWQVGVLLSAFLVDAGLTLAKRILQGRRFWQAHREHLYQLAVARGHSHLGVCLAYAGWAILAAGIAIGWGDPGATGGAAIALVVGSVGAAAWLALRLHWSRRDTRMDAST